jgi:hypothetical protein
MSFENEKNQLREKLSPLVPEANLDAVIGVLFDEWDDPFGESDATQNPEGPSGEERDRKEPEPGQPDQEPSETAPAAGGVFQAQETGEG